MVSIQGGPVGITLAIIGLLAIGYALAQAGTWVRRRRSAEHKEAIKQWETVVEETKVLIDKNEKPISIFVHTFSEDIVNHFGGEPWIKHVTIHDIRMMAETALFNLVQGCPCGNCAGVANGGPFAVEASFSDEGISLTGIVTQRATRVELAGKPSRVGVFEHHENVTMVCEACKTTPVVTSIDHIAQGKRPTCAACIARGARA